MEKFNGFRPLVAFVLGGPGSGKGTQCKRICDEFNYAHLSAGDLLRSERNNPESKYGQLIEKHIQEGTIVPVEITCNLIEEAMTKHCKTLLYQQQQQHQQKQQQHQLKGKFLIDGFPRNKDNLDGWTKQLAHKVETKFVLFLDCPHDVCIQRCLKRGELGSNRSDDNETSLRKRLVTFEEDTMPIVEHYRRLNLLKSIDATASPDEVYDEVKKLFVEFPASAPQ